MDSEHPLSSVYDLLTPEERLSLRNDLAEIKRWRKWMEHNERWTGPTMSSEHPPTHPGYDAVGHEADLRRLAPIDLGDDHAIGWTPTGDLYWLHRCSGDDYRGEQPWRWSLGTIDVTSGQRHVLRKRLPVDVGGSILCVSCGDHGFVNNGKWVKA